MKICSYCGKQYPDEVTICPADGETLPGSFADRKKITGVWRGVYGYGPRESQAGFEPVPFTLKLKQGWLAHFDGSVADEGAPGNPLVGIVDGYLNSPKVEFTKQMPVGYVIGPDGIRRTLREHLLAEGHPCEHELPAAPVFYQGSLLDANRMQGIWTISARPMSLLGNLSLFTNQISGYWCAQFITTDLNGSPSDGPSEQLFDKSLLSPSELEEVEGIAFVSMGKFSVADFQMNLDRIVRSNIRFRTARDEESKQQALPIEEMLGSYAGMAEMIEIFVHPDDLAEAGAILHANEQA